MLVDTAIDHLVFETPLEYFLHAVRQFAQRPCVISRGMTYRYEELDEDAGRLASYLHTRGVTLGDRIGILLQPSYDAYVSIVAAMKVGATFVPMDGSSPSERIAYIVRDANVKLIVTHAGFVHQGFFLPDQVVVQLDAEAGEIEKQSARFETVVTDVQRLCYIIYTSGSTGRPKGVAITNSNYANYLGVVPPIYGIEACDRVYQGLSIAFDFSLDEIFPTLMAGGIIITSSQDPADRVGAGLSQFLDAFGITVLHTVPTLLSTLEQDCTSLKKIFLGGEVCARELAQRWCRPGRRILNTYGPTETTITATWTEIGRDENITIGIALPSYRVDVRNEELLPVAPGEEGEICISGPCVAAGYVNRPDLTAQRFVSAPEDPLIRMYRTGDLGRVCPNGNIQFLGRADTQVKIRGYRIELGEIEEVLLANPNVAGVLVNPWQGKRKDDVNELVAYLIMREGLTLTDEKVAELHDQLQKNLPGYMRPAFFVPMSAFPVMASGKADRSRLPAPNINRALRPNASMQRSYSDTEEAILRIWCDIFHHETLSVTQNFFTDLGGHSLYAARVISRLRCEPGFEKTAIRDLYSHPTVESLAQHIDSIAKTRQISVNTNLVSTHSQSRVEAGILRICFAGSVQVASLAILSFLFAVPLLSTVTYLPYHGVLQSLGSIATVALTSLALSLALPVLVKWSIIGRIRPGRYQIWHSYFLRFWVMQKALAIAPWHLLTGTPLMNIYLRMLGCRIGKCCILQSWCLPDIVTLANQVSVGYNTDLLAFEYEKGWLIIAPICIGDGVSVGNSCVVGPGAQLEPGCVVGHQAAVPPSTVVSKGMYWDGSPGSATQDIPHVYQQMAGESPNISQYATVIWAIFSAVAIPILYLLPVCVAVVSAAPLIYLYQQGGWLPALGAIIPVGFLFVCLMCFTLAALYRIVSGRARAGRVAHHSIQGWRKWFADRLIVTSLTTTNALYATLYTKFWLRLIGVKVGAGAEVSTLSFFDPALLRLGKNCFIADMASLGAATFHCGWYVTDNTSVGERAFVGNSALVPAGSTIGDGALLGVLSKPASAVLLGGTSWLGAPAMFLPNRDVVTCFGESLTYKATRIRVLQRYVIEFLRISLPSGIIIANGVFVSSILYQMGDLNIAVLSAMMLPVVGICAVGSTIFVVLLKWLTIGTYSPTVKPLWSHAVWRSELITGLYENVAVTLLLQWLTGTPLIGPVLRLFGTKIGRGVLCDTTFCSEFDLVNIGDHAAIGRNVSLQTHLFEDRVMKMDVVEIGSNVDVGSRAIVLYDTALLPCCKIGSLSLILKGEAIQSGSSWSGIPASYVGHA